MQISVVTGATSGLGAQIVDLLVGRGEAVVGTCRGADDPGARERTGVRLVPVDLSRPTEVVDLAHDLASTVSDRATSVVFYNNAGVIGPIDLVGTLGDPAAVAAHIAVNYTAPVVLLDALVGALPAGATLEVVNITSGAAERPIPGWSLYCSSKKAVKSFLDVLAAEHEHVSVRHVDPGVMDTGMQAQIRAADESAFPGVATFRGYQQDGRLRTPGEVAREIVTGGPDR